MGVQALRHPISGALSLETMRKLPALWGVGPTTTFPTATESLFGNGKWSAGPPFVLLTTPGHWVIGALANNQWSFAGWGNKSVDALLVQTFINYNFPHGWYITTSPIITANWAAASNERWTLSIGGGVGKIIKIDKLPINVMWLLVVLVARLGGKGSGGFVHDTATRFLGLTVIAMGVQFALTGMRSFMYEPDHAIQRHDANAAGVTRSVCRTSRGCDNPALVWSACDARFLGRQFRVSQIAQC